METFQQQEYRRKDALIQTLSPLLAFVIVFTTEVPLFLNVIFADPYAGNGIFQLDSLIFLILYCPLVSIVSSVGFWEFVKWRYKNSHGAARYALTISMLSAAVWGMSVIYLAWVFIGAMLGA